MTLAWLNSVVQARRWISSAGSARLLAGAGAFSAVVSSLRMSLAKLRFVMRTLLAGLSRRRGTPTRVGVCRPESTTITLGTWIRRLLGDVPLTTCATLIGGFRGVLLDPVHAFDEDPPARDTQPALCL